MKAYRLITMLILAAMMPLAASAYDFMVDGLYYNFNNIERTTVAVTSESEYSPGYSNLSGDLVIPESVTYNDKTYSVTEIDLRAFSSCSGLTSVVIPNTVTSIGDYAFYGCTGLTSINLGSSIQEIGYRAFGSCNNLTSLTMGNSADIGWDAFPFSLTTLTITGVGFSGIDVDDSSGGEIMNNLKTINIGSWVRSKSDKLLC